MVALRKCSWSECALSGVFCPSDRNNWLKGCKPSAEVQFLVSYVRSQGNSLFAKRAHAPLRSLLPCFPPQCADINAYPHIPERWPR